MEDTARLALVEQSVRNPDKFSKVLFELFRFIYYILENPQDNQFRVIKNNLLKEHLKTDTFVEYLKYIGFEMKNNEMFYPKEKTLSKLRVAHAAIQRKISFCCGNSSLNNMPFNPGNNTIQATKPKLSTVNILKTKNSLLLQLENMLNRMLQFEDEQLHREARSVIPIVKLQLMAIDRMREHQQKIKTGETKLPDLPYDIALLMELMGWFKHKFFKWVDKPQCDRCNGDSKYVYNTTLFTETEMCNVEVYECLACKHPVKFPRRNDPLALLRSRRGRCGEWAACFTLLCRALGYDTRFVCDNADHVWCEVYDYDSKQWLHVDPCEGQLNAPLTYCHGWGKKLAYVFAASRDDVQDVTWRYTTDHKEVLKRRTGVSEGELVEVIVSLRERRQRQVSEARRRYLARRTLEELAQLMVERKPEDFESHGRISGSKEWRTQRGEVGAHTQHTFVFASPGDISISYFPVADEYRIVDGDKASVLKSWAAGVYSSSKVFRKYEHDWNMVYLAREEDADTGSVSWRVRAEPGTKLTSVCVRARTATYASGRVQWTVRLDDGTPRSVDITDTPVTFDGVFDRVEVSASLSGGDGARGWQHAQLFRSDAAHSAPGLRLAATVTRH